MGNVPLAANTSKLGAHPATSRAAQAALGTRAGSTAASHSTHGARAASTRGCLENRRTSEGLDTAATGIFTRRPGAAAKTGGAAAGPSGRPARTTCAAGPLLRGGTAPARPASSDATGGASTSAHPDVPCTSAVAPSRAGRRARDAAGTAADARAALTFLVTTAAFNRAPGRTSSEDRTGRAPAAATAGTTNRSAAPDGRGDTTEPLPTRGPANAHQGAGLAPCGAVDRRACTGGRKAERFG